MLFFAEERGLRKEEDDLEEKEFVFVVVVANIMISVFPSFCGFWSKLFEKSFVQDQFLLFCCRCCCFSSSCSSSLLSSSLLSSALLFSHKQTKASGSRHRNRKQFTHINTHKKNKKKTLPSLCACVIRLCKDLLRFELPLL